MITNLCMDLYLYPLLSPHLLCIAYINQTPGLHVLLGLVYLLLLHLEDHLEQVPHGHHHLARGLLRLDPEEPVPVLWAAVDVSEGAVVRHVLGDEADLVHGVVVQTVLHTALVNVCPDINLSIFTPDFSSRILSPSTAIWMLTLCLCSPLALMAILSSCSASWHIRSPRASRTSSTPISFPLKVCPSPMNFCSFPPRPKQSISVSVHQDDHNVK